MIPSVEMGKPEALERFNVTHREGIKIYIDRSLFISNEILLKLIENMIK